jgi:hypothetical protein
MTRKQPTWEERVSRKFIALSRLERKRWSGGAHEDTKAKHKRRNSKAARRERSRQINGE